LDTTPGQIAYSEQARREVVGNGGLRRGDIFAAVDRLGQCDALAKSLAVIRHDSNEQHVALRLSAERCPEATYQRYRETA
jgi:hypothetical protein